MATLIQKPIDIFIKRPAFVSGTKFHARLQPVKLDFPMQKRELDVEGRLKRRNFQLSAPKARPAKTIEEIEALRTKQQGIKIRLGPGAFGRVRVAKRDKDGKIILDEEGKPIMEERELDLSTATLPLQDRLDALAVMAQEGVQTFVGTKLDQLGILLASILDNSRDMASLTRSNLELLSSIVSVRGDVPIDPTQGTMFADLEGNRFLTKAAWDADNEGLQTRVNLFLINRPSATNPSLNPAEPIMGRTGPMSVASMERQLGRVSGLGRDHPVLDLGTRKMFQNIADARQSAGEPAELDPAAADPAAGAEQKAEEKEEQPPPIQRLDVLQEALAGDLSDPNILNALVAGAQQTQVGRDPSVPRIFQPGGPGFRGPIPPEPAPSIRERFAGSRLGQFLGVQPGASGEGMRGSGIHSGIGFRHF